MNKFAIAALAALGAASAWAVQGKITVGSNTMEGQIKWQARSKAYVVSYKKGKQTIDMEVKLADKPVLDIARPNGYDRAVELVEKGNGAGAIVTLQKIVEDYRMLTWDKPAGRYLVMAHLSAGNAQKAFEIASGIISDDPSAAYTGELAPAYWQSLLKLGKTQQLESQLRKASASADRATSAAALVMRGDVIVAEGGESNDSLKKALTDAYLRVSLMYLDDECRAVRREAMMKASGCFKKLGQAQRAEQLSSEAQRL